MRTHGNRNSRVPGGGAVTLHGRDRGSATVEAVLVVPLLVLVAFFVFAGGRLAAARAEVDAAARDAARTATIERSAPAARRAATRAASASLGDAGTRCAAVDVGVGDSSFRPGGSVSVEVACTVSLGDLVAGLPGSRTVRSSFTATVDTYRGVRR